VCFFRTGENWAQEIKMRRRFQLRQTRLACVFAALLLVSRGILAATGWQSTLTTNPGDFPEPRPLRAKYNFGWSGITAATGDVHFTKPSLAEFQLDSGGRTVGLARALWRLDANYHGVADAQMLRPIETNQTESYRWKQVATHLSFTVDGVKSTRTEAKTGAAASTKTREFKFANLFDLHSALLVLRSQPLRDHGIYRVAVYPATSAYLATVTVRAREKISVRAGNYNAIKVDLRLQKIGKNLELQPHRKFRRATAWVSDDQDRILLRIEAQIFVGTVFAELQSVHFEK
jgi:hypothetical protein